VPVELKLNRAVQGESVPPEILAPLVKAVAGIRYGSVEVTIHDSRVVQIEAREKIRFQSEGRQTQPGTPQLD